MVDRDDDIRAAVRRYYGDIAQLVGQDGGAGACCDAQAGGGQSCCEPALYPEALLTGLPGDVTGLSLGCGDPVTIAGLQPGETVLDLGSGGGIDCFMAARQVGDEGYVIGVDMTPEMIARANRNKARLGAENVEFRLGQIEALPVDDESVDVVMSNCVINLSPDKLATFREAFRVLRPGGRVSISDIVTQGDFTPEQRQLLDLWAGCVTGAIDAGAYVALMREAGLVDVEVVDKASAEAVIGCVPGVPRIFSARITARKPA